MILADPTCNATHENPPAMCLRCEAPVFLQIENQEVVEGVVDPGSLRGSHRIRAGIAHDGSH